MRSSGDDGRTPARRTPEALAEELVDGLRPDRRLLVALDHDGTISPIAPRPDDAVLARGTAEALTAVSDHARVVVLSGRALADLVVRLGHLPVQLVAEHGLRMRDGEGRIVGLAEPIDATVLDAVRERLTSLLTAARRDEGWLIEDKGVGIAVHHRLVAPERIRATLDQVREVLRAVPGGRVQEGKAVIELRAEGAEKGAALARLLADSGDALPLMVGDDLTDETAFRVAEAAGGVGVLVASEPRPSAASVSVADPSEVVRLLEALTHRLASRLTPGRSAASDTACTS